MSNVKQNSLADLGFEVIRNGHLLGDGRIPIITPMRNERVLVGPYIEHYRQFADVLLIVIDNGSNDGTFDYLRSLDHIVLLSTRRSYRESNFAVDWVNDIVRLYYENRWVVHLDCDELLVLPSTVGSNLVGWLEVQRQLGVDCVFTPMIDMYPNGSIMDTHIETATDVARLRFFDSHYRFLPWPVRFWERPGGNSIVVAGGPLWRLLALKVDQPPGAMHRTLVNLGGRFSKGASVSRMWSIARATPTDVPARHKMAINFAVPGFHWVNSHVSSNHRFSKVNGALLHMKFCSNIARRIALSLETRQHYMGGMTDCQLALALQRWGNRTLVDGQSKEFSSAADLEAVGLIGESVLSEPHRSNLRLSSGV